MMVAERNRCLVICDFSLWFHKVRCVAALWHGRFGVCQSGISLGVSHATHNSEARAVLLLHVCPVAETIEGCPNKA
jgi:DNA-binding IclR family transcriptional regulator